MARRSRSNEETALADLLKLAPAADRARLAGIGAARAVVAARAVQLAREAHRARARYGDDDPRAQALTLRAERQALRVARVEAEFERAQVEPPAPAPDATVVFGRVVERGRGRPGLTVSARGPAGDVRAFDCTDRVGAFRLTVSGAGTVRLRVTDRDGAILHAGTEEIGVGPGRIFHREIRLGETPPDICPPPPDDPTGGTRPDVVRVPDLLGRPEAEAVRLLTAVGLTVGGREEADAPDDVGLVIKQAPEPNAEVPPGSAVAIVVGRRTDVRVPELIGRRLADARAAIVEASLAVGTIEMVVEPEREDVVLKQDPEPGARVERGTSVALVVGRAAAPVRPELVLELVVADPRFASVRMSGDEFLARAERLGLRNREALERVVNMADGDVRDAFELPALRDAQTLKRVLREALARTG